MRPSRPTHQSEEILCSAHLAELKVALLLLLGVLDFQPRERSLARGHLRPRALDLAHAVLARRHGLGVLGLPCLGVALGLVALLEGACAPPPHRAHEPDTPCVSRATCGKGQGGHMSASTRQARVLSGLVGGRWRVAVKRGNER